jgi:hypothetical protein
MAEPNKLLLPGFGGAVDVTLTAGETSVHFDMSRCAQFALQMKSETGTASVQAQQSFDGLNWANLGAAFTSAGATLKFDITDGPHGLIRFVQTAAAMNGSVMRIVGWPIQGVN